MARILLADDQRDVLEALRILLKSEGYQTEGVTSLSGIFHALEKKEYSLLVMDLNYTRDTTSGQEGLAAIVKIQEIDPTLPIVVMTAWATIELAVEAMKRGARDFVTKPWDNQRLLTIVRTQIELAAALRRERKLEAENELLRGTMPDLIAQSPAMRPVVEMISRVAPSDANVLITGENGTGKTLIAHAIHALSPRATRTMITVNMGGLSETLFESELFGHVKGAFTGAVVHKRGLLEVADGGSVFLDEIGNIDLTIQAKLLRVIQEREFKAVGDTRTRSTNIRLIAATNKDLREMVGRGAFRDDLFYRVNIFPIRVPPLRERQPDIPALAFHFLAECSAETGRKVTQISDGAMAMLVNHDWPGNVRELENTIHRAVILASGNVIRKAHLAELSEGAAAGPVPRTGEELKERKREARAHSVEGLEKAFLLEALKRNGWNVTRSAEETGMLRANFQALMKKHGIRLRDAADSQA
jgi:DNA-binding NtrC family response regulator